MGPLVMIILKTIRQQINMKLLVEFALLAIKLSLGRGTRAGATAHSADLLTNVQMVNETFTHP